MKCGGCVGHVKRVLEEQENVTEVCVCVCACVYMCACECTCMCVLTLLKA